MNRLPIPDRAAARPGAWARMAQEVIRVDRGALALVPAARSAVGIAVPLVAGDLSGNLLVGVVGAIGALIAGMASLQGTYRSRVKVMAAAAVAFAVSAFVGATIGHVLGADIAVTAAWGFAAGLLVIFGQSPGVVGLLAVIGLVVFSQFHLTAQEAGLDALWALCGATLQIVLVAVVWPLQRFPTERRACGAAYRLLASHVRHLTSDPSALLDPAALDALRTALVETQPLGDPASAAAYQALADEAERIRLETAAIARSRARLATAPEGDTAAERTVGAGDPQGGAPTGGTPAADAAYELAVAVTAAADLLAEAADALHDGRTMAAGGTSPERFRSAVEHLRSMTGSADRRDRAILTEVIGSLTALAGQLRAVAQLTAVAAGEHPTAPRASSAESAGPHRATRPPWRPASLGGALRDHLGSVRANLTLTSEAFRHALRVGVTLAVAVAISHLFPLGHGYWLPMTVMIVLKPDFTATFSRGLARSVGTVLGAGLVTLVLAGLRPPPAGLIVLTVALYAVSIATLAANYVVYSVGIASLVVILLAFTGSPALSLAADRVFYTVVGAALALAAYAIWPTWERTRVTDRLADLVETDGHYGAALLQAWADPAAADRAALDLLRRAARLARSNAEASVARWLSEPAGRGGAGSDPIPVDKAQGIVAEVHRFVWGALALHGQLPDDGPVRPDLRRLGIEIDDALTAVAGALRTGSAPCTYPSLRTTQVALAARLLHAAPTGEPDPAAAHQAMLLVSETDLVVNAVDTLAHLVGVGPPAPP